MNKKSTDEPDVLHLVFAVTLVAALSLSMWWLAYFPAYYLVYLSNWMMIFNELFGVAVVASQRFEWADRAALLSAPLLLSSDILWAIYTLGLALFGAACFKNAQQATFAYYSYAACTIYNHFAPLILLIYFVTVRFGDSVSAWTRTLSWVFGTGIHTRICAFAGTLLWLLAPAVPCLAYSSITNPLDVYGITITLDQINGILAFAICVHAVVATTFLYYVFFFWTRGEYPFDRRR